MKLVAIEVTRGSRNGCFRSEIDGAILTACGSAGIRKRPRTAANAPRRQLDVNAAHSLARFDSHKRRRQQAIF
jgi:hypothetical protein